MEEVEALNGAPCNLEKCINLENGVEMLPLQGSRDSSSDRGSEPTEWKFTPCSLIAKYKKNTQLLRLSTQGIIFSPVGGKSVKGGFIRTTDIVGVTKEATKSGMTQIFIHTAYYTSRGGCIKPLATPKLVREVYNFQSESNLELDQYLSELDNLLYNNPNNKRPRRLVVIINPIGGRGKARTEYERKARPIFQLARVHLTEILTERKHHVYDILAELDLSQFDGIVSVGGDGMFFEIVNAIMRRPDHPTAIRVPIGIIPAGSQNALAVSCSGTVDAQCHALDIIRGYSMPMDAVKVQHVSSGKIIYSSIVTAFGYIADVGNTAQSYRHLGPLRYIYCGAMHLTKPKFYKIKLNYIPHDGEEWKMLEEEIFCFMACNLNCANTQFSALCPQALPTDGCMSLCVWKKCSRFNMMQFSSRQKKGTHIHLPFVHMLKVKALKFEPMTEGGFINIDGEIFERSELEFELKPSFITLMCSPCT